MHGGDGCTGQWRGRFLEAPYIYEYRGTRRSHICLGCCLSSHSLFSSTAPTGTLTMPFWCTFDKVARHANLTEPPASLMVPKMGKSVCNNDHAFLYVSCSVNAQGSALHLAALDVYIRRMIPNEWDAVLQVRKKERCNLLLRMRFSG